MGQTYVSYNFIYLKSRYDQGILDVGMTKEDKVELVKTHSFTRKHATGKAKIELHVLQVQKLLTRILFNEYFDGRWSEV